jgi:predicted metal-dependent phosphoesterase TrpH
MLLMTMKKYDLHSHTNFSSDSVNRPERMVEMAKKAGLSGIAITDHHTIKGALLAKKLNKDRNFEVIIGEEIATDHGDVVALYIKEEIRTRNFFKVIENIRRQRGLVIIPHPFRLHPRFSYPLDKLKGKIDAIETINSRYGISNMMAKRLVKRISVAQVGSSDGHSSFDIGRAYTVFEGDLRSAIRRRKTIAGGSARYGLISQVISTFSQFISLIRKGLP